MSAVGAGGARPLSVVALTPPGRLPTVSVDPGRWWDALAADGRFRLARYSASAAWWRAICGPPLATVLGRTVRRRWTWRRRAALARSAVEAGEALDRLGEAATFRCAERYVAAAAALERHLELLNGAQRELSCSLELGVRVRGVEYDDSRALVRHARRTGVLRDLVRVSLAGCPAADLVVVSVGSPEELLLALLAAECLRELRPGVHVTLADHGWENFSLAPHLERLRTARTLDSVFDTIVETRDERDAVVPALARALLAGGAPVGWLRAAALGADVSAPPAPPRAPPPVPTFAPEPVGHLRLSERRCYWSRCTFCVQNAKFDDHRAPSAGEMLGDGGALARIASFADAGYRTLYFSDEALSPARLRALCRGLIGRGLHTRLRWACRSKLEHAFADPELAHLLHAAGCREVLFGLETTSPRLQRLMGKHTPGLDADAVEGVLHALDDAGVGVHVNLLSGFPGERPAELVATVDFTTRVLATLRNATFLLNRFDLYPDTPVARDPARFGITTLPASGDIPFRLGYRVSDGLAEDARVVDAYVEHGRERLAGALGWDALRRRPGGGTAFALYSLTGHGVLYKAGDDNPFVNPLLAPPFAA